jgi:signal transduction histidine kinase
MTDPHYQASTQHIRSLLCVPVFTTDHEPLGVINAVTTEKPRVFLEREIDFLMRFGRQAALAIENAKLHQKSRANINQLSELSKLKSQFLSLVSHDLRGPLTGIRGYCEVLKQEQLGALSPGQAELLEQMERQVELQERMVDDLLDLARMEKGHLSIHLAPTHLVQLLQEEVEKSQMDARERKITLTLAADIPPAHAMVEIDGGRIRQVVWNLIYNALKFTPEEGHVTVRAAVKDHAIVVEVEDTGIGLAEETKNKVFEKFFQISPGGTASSQGLGLGLAICKEIITAHEGSIHAQSPGLGLGTVMSFSLPLTTVAADKKHPKTLAA